MQPLAMISGSSFDLKRRDRDIGAIDVLRRGGRKFQYGTAVRILMSFTIVTASFLHAAPINCLPSTSSSQ
jgi:hypothetical protein